RLRARADDPRELQQHAPDRDGLPLSRPPSPNETKVGHLRVEHLREWPARSHLHAHSCRRETARGRAHQVATAHLRPRCPNARAPNGEPIMKWPWETRREADDRELDDEIRAHFTMAVADRVARGESPDAAAAAVRREFGNVGHVKEVTHETWGWLWLERLTHDVRYALRSLRRAPIFAV